MEYQKAVQNGEEILKRAGISEAKLDARLLLEYVCKTDHSTLLVHPDKELTSEEEELYNELIGRREKREPLSYITGSRGFMGFDFKVSEAVLIPEQDSEFLVEEALRFCEDRMRILDLCTGSGCIAISILKYTNNTTALGTDISSKALEIARGNAELLDVKDRISFKETDLFPDPDEGKFDIIVSNPPYIATKVIEGLEPEVKDYEPRIALDGEEDGLAFYRRIAEKAGEYLYSSGYLILEIGYDQGEAVKNLLEEKECYHDIQVIKDYSGNDRVVSACFY